MRHLCRRANSVVPDVHRHGMGPKGTNNVSVRDVDNLIMWPAVDDACETDAEVTYQIVGDDEADIKNNRISVNSPIARGLIGKQADDAVIIKTPNGDVEYEVIEVEYV